MKKDFKFLKWNGKRAVALLSLTIILSLLTIGGTLAYIFVETGILESIFAPAKVEVSINGNEIINNSEIPVYARVAVIATWEKDGVTISEKPVLGIDYTMSINSDWKQGSDGYWYYTKPISQNEHVGFITSVSANTAPEGCELVIEILSSVIQTKPEDAVEKSWGEGIVSVNGDGTLSIQQ